MGCEFCNGKVNEIKSYDGYSTVYLDTQIKGRTLSVEYDAYSRDSRFDIDICISYCPVCGRKLEETKKNE